MTPYEGQPLAVLVTVVEPAGGLRHYIVDGGAWVRVESPADGALSLRAQGMVRTLSESPPSHLGGQDESAVRTLSLAGHYEGQRVRISRGDETAWGRLRYARVAPAEWLAFRVPDPSRAGRLQVQVQGAAAVALWHAVARPRDWALWGNADEARRRDFQTEVGIAAMLAVAALLRGEDPAGTVWRGTVVGVRLAARVGGGAVWLSLDTEGAD